MFSLWHRRSGRRRSTVFSELYGRLSRLRGETTKNAGEVMNDLKRAANIRFHLEPRRKWAVRVTGCPV